MSGPGLATSAADPAGPLFSPDDFDALALSYGVCQGDCDLVLLGDGSGGQLGTPAGWCVHLYHPSTRRVRTLAGAVTAATNNWSELSPYLHALWYFESVRQKAGKGGRRCRVLIVTDSELTARCGSGRYSRNSNLPLWAMLDWFLANSYEIRWEHARRNTTPMAEEADRIAGEARVLMKGFAGVVAP